MSNVHKVQWTIQAPWGTIYTTWNLLRFMSGRPEFFPRLTTDYATAVYCADTLAAGARSVAKGRCFLFAGGWRVLDRSDKHDAIVAANVKLPARFTWVLVRSPEGKTYRVGNLRGLCERAGLVSKLPYMTRLLETAIKDNKWPYPMRNGWTYERLIDRSEFTVIRDPQDVHYAIKTRTENYVHQLRGGSGKYMRLEWTLCDPYGYAYITQSLYRFLRERPHVFPDAHTSYVQLDNIIRKRCGLMEGTLLLANGWTAIDRSDAHDLIYNGVPNTLETPEPPSAPGVCAVCGKSLPKGQQRYCGEACRKKADARRVKQNTGRPRGNPEARWLTHCVDCGKLIYRPIKCIRCEACQLVINKYRHKVQQRTEPSRPLGSTDICQVCGKPYVVQASLQKYCPACRDVGAKQSISKRKSAYRIARMNDPEIAQKTREAKHCIPSPKFCAHCGKPFFSKNRAMYCCDACRQAGSMAYHKEYEANRAGTRQAYNKMAYQKRKEKQSKMKAEKEGDKA